MAADYRGQTRFLFAEPPDILVEPNDGIGNLTESDETAISRLESLVRSILYENRFEEALIKAAKDCFIGKRVAGVVNFDEEYGVTLTFIPATQFLFETSFYNSNVIEKFVYFRVFHDCTGATPEKRIYKKKYTLEEGIVFVAETVHNDSGDILKLFQEKRRALVVREVFDTIYESCYHLIYEILDSMGLVYPFRLEIALFRFFENRYHGFLFFVIISQRSHVTNFDPFRRYCDH